MRSKDHSGIKGQRPQVVPGELLVTTEGKRGVLLQQIDARGSQSAVLFTGSDTNRHRPMQFIT